MKYKLGIDIGTNSVGWAVLDENNNLVRKLGHSMWGVRMFPESKSAAERRTYRGSRRRIKRRKERINLLRTIFAKEIEAVDSTFFRRLDESFYCLEDRTIDCNQLFLNLMTDSVFYKKYPTIYHLRSDLIHKKDEKFDIRMVYLACHHIIKYRGNFLYEGDEFKQGNLDSVKSVLISFNELVKNVYERFSSDEDNDIKAIEYFSSLETIDEVLINKIKEIYLSNENKVAKKKKLNELFNFGNKNIYNELFVELIISGEIKLNKLLPLKNELEENLVLNLDSETIISDAEDAASKCGIIGDIISFIPNIKTIRDYFFILRLLGDNKDEKEKYFSDIIVEKYIEHGDDLNKLKKFFKKHLPDQYNAFFRKLDKSLNNYSKYVGMNKVGIKTTSGHVTRKDFYKTLSTILDQVKNPEAQEEVKYFKDKIEKEDLLLRQNDGSNGAIPMQLHFSELKTILNNQAKFYPFLLEGDKVNNIEKILSIFKFKRPYFVGPLKGNDESNKYNWALIKQGGYIYPWNFEEKIDIDETAKEFILRMQNKCSYLKGDGDFTLPKDSIYYSEYNVLSYINKIKINGTFIDRKLKEDLYNNVFLKISDPSKKDVINFLNTKLDINLTKDDIPDCNVKLSSYIKMKDILKEEYSIDLVENIIKDIAIFEDKKVLDKRLREIYKLNDEKIKEIKGLNYKGFGRLSRRLLAGLEILDCETGEYVNGILPILRTTNLNLQEILYSDRFKLSEVIDEYNKQFLYTESKNKDEEFVEFLEENLSLSPIYYRAFLQTYKLIEEIEDILKQPIDQYVIEVTRTNKELKGKKGIKKSRYDSIKEIYKEASKLNSDINKDELDYLNAKADEFKERINKTDKYYLYFTQLGKDIYTLEPIDLDSLIDYDIDHIYPQALVKDDSLSNRVLTLKFNNETKKDTLLPEMRKKGFLNKNADAFYNLLYKKGLISKAKFNRLTEKETSKDFLDGFINRQKVATDQATIALITTLKYFKGVDPLNIIYSKSENIHDFRNRSLYFDKGEKHEFYLPKSRIANNYHHAHDAYLNAYIGSVLDKYYRYYGVKGSNFYFGDKDYSVNPSRILSFSKKAGDNYIRVTDHNIKEITDIDKIFKTISTNFDIQETKWISTINSMYSKVTILPKGSGMVPPKRFTPNNNTFDIDKYGGITSDSYSKYCIVEAVNKNGVNPLLIAIPRSKVNIINEYLDSKLNKFESYKIINSNIKNGEIIEYGKLKFAITGVTGNEFVLINQIDRNFSLKDIEMIHKIEKYFIYKKNNIKVVDDSELICFYEKDKRNEKDLFRKIEISKDELMLLINTIINKYKRDIYSYSIVNSITEKIEKFNIDFLNAKDLIILANELLNFLKTNERNLIDLSIIGSSSKSGTLKIRSSLKSGIKFVRYSLTGLRRKIIYEVK